MQTVVAPSVLEDARRLRAGGILGVLAANPARSALAAIVAVSFAVRWVASLAHVAPYYLPDEYIYSALGRGLAETGRPVARGAGVAFPALLEPLLTAPLWLLFGDPLTVLRLTQVLHAFEVSLAAIPAYLLARRLRLDRRFGLACAAFAVMTPGLFWASFALADPVAYPLALTTLYLAVRALENPSPRGQLAFIALAALTAFARTQYLILPLCYLASALVVERGNVMRVVRSQTVVVALFGGAVAASLAAGATQALGPYVEIARLAPQPLVFMQWAGLELLVVALASGLILVPGALVGLDLVLSKPQSRAEHAFGALFLFTAGALIVVAGFVPDTRIHERYLLVLAPLVPLAFGVWLRRARPRRLVVAGITAGMLIAAVLVDLAGHDATHSPTVRALARLEQQIGLSGLGRVAVALLAVCGFAVLLPRRRVATVALVLAAGTTAALSVGAYAYDRENARVVREGRLPSEPNWIDRAGLEDVALLQTVGASRWAALEQMFWNQSVNRVLLARGAAPLDFLETFGFAVADDGTIRHAGVSVRSPLLVPRRGMRLQFVGTELVRKTNEFELWRPDGIPRVVSAIPRQSADGWLPRRGTVSVWPRALGVDAGILALELSLPASVTSPVTVRFAWNDRVEFVTIEPGEQRILSFDVESRASWQLAFEAVRPLRVGKRVVSVRSAEPVFRASSPG